MKPNFALSLSFDGLRLMHRVAGGWELVGEVALDDEDLTGALARLRVAGESLDPGAMTTKILLPNAQIKYVAIDSTRTDEEDVQDALDGATPYTLDQLAYDFSKGGGRTYVAAVARETLDEAEAFATEHDFNPVCFVGVPEPFTYMGEPFFGTTKAAAGQEIERDNEPVVVIGVADLPRRQDDAVPDPEIETVAIDPDAPAAVPEEPTLPPAPMPEPVPATTPDPLPEEDIFVTESEAPAQDPVAQVESASEDDTPAPVDVPAEEDEATPDAAAPAPVFGSRRNGTEDSGPAPALGPARADDDSVAAAPVFGSRRNGDNGPAAKPAPSRADPPPLAVPTDVVLGGPPLSGAMQDEEAPPATSDPVMAETPDIPEEAPAVTGAAATAVPAEEAPALAATLSARREFEDPLGDDSASDDPETEPEPEETAPDPVPAGGLAGGMFRSRRMARKAAAAKAADAEAPDEKSRMTVFGARKKPKPKPVVGGKPKYLGLILTAVLLLLLLAVAALAALNEDVVSRWFGWDGDGIETAATDTPVPDIPAPAAPEVVASDTDDPAAVTPPPASDTDALEAGIAMQPTGQVLSPAEAERIYAATGVWQRAPRIQVLPRIDGAQEIAVSTGFSQAVRNRPGDPPDQNASGQDSVIAAPVNPPPPTAEFDFNENGLVVATPEGAVTPDGILVIAGTPPLNPPTRPGTVAPEVTPLEQLASVIPEDAAPLPESGEGLLVIAGRPSLTPPIRPGTVAPEAEPQASETVAAPETAAPQEEGLNVIAGRPPLEPPVRPGTVAPDQATAPEAATPQSEVVEEGLIVIAGRPPLEPPVRPGTAAPDPEAEASATPETPDAEALTPGSVGLAGLQPDGASPAPLVQTSGQPGIRPRTRPATITAVATAPVIGDLTRREAASFRPQARPAGLVPEAATPPEPETPDPQPEPISAPAPTGLQLSEEIAAAVQAAANRPDPFAGATAQAIPRSLRPDTRPRNMDRIVARAAEAARSRPAAPAAAPVATPARPSGPTTASVAQAATEVNAINLRDINLIGVYGSQSDRHAWVRLGNGRMQRVEVGDRLDGGRVQAIGDSYIIYSRRGRNVTLQVGG